MATWAEVKELANQLKKTQATQGLLRLPERTWVDIITHLTNSARLKLIFTCDGRSYLTKDELDKEIREEVEAHSGRVAIHELATILDIESCLIETRASELIAGDHQSSTADKLIGIPGELLNVTYTRKVAHEIQYRLEVTGHVSIGELASSFSLPTYFLTDLIQEYQGKLFNVHKYGENYLTDAYLHEHRSRVRGYFIAVIRPIVITTAATKLHIPESLVTSLLEGLLSSGRLYGSLVAGRGTYIPTCYVQAEANYVNAFYAQNGYVEWDNLKRLGIAEPAVYLRTRFPAAVHTNGVTVGPTIVEQLKTVVEDAVLDSTWTDLTHFLPSSLNESQRYQLLAPIIKDQPLQAVVGNLFIITEAFAVQQKSCFDQLLREKAELAILERRKSSVQSKVIATPDSTSSSKKMQKTPKGGFGIGARELKLKNVKKKYCPSSKQRGGNKFDDDYEDNLSHDKSINVEAEFAKYVPIEDLEDLLQGNLKDVPSEVVEGVVTMLLPELHRSFSAALNSILLPASDTAMKNESFAACQETINNMLLCIQLLERGVLAVDQPALQDQLLRHLMRSNVTCLVDRVCDFLAKEHEISWPDTDARSVASKPTPDAPVTTSGLAKESAVTTDQRMRLPDLLQSVGAVEASSRLRTLIESMRIPTQSAAPHSLASFYEAFEKLTVDCIGFNISALLPRAESKRKRDERAKSVELALQMELQMLSAVKEMSVAGGLVTSAATVCLASACLFTQALLVWPISASGKHVPELTKWLATKMAEKSSPKTSSPALKMLLECEAIEKLQSLAAMVTSMMRSDLDDHDVNAVNEAVQKLCEIAKSCRKLFGAS